MVMQTLNSLARLDYPNFEVILLDNNTSDESLWRPVASHCESLGSRFRFYHLDDVKGFKAGALNKALELTDPSAEFIAVIDSDYQVAPHWLRSVMPGFDDPKVGIVQAPQDYRDANENLFKSFLYEEYTGFFRIGMVERAEHNAIIQHGTMCVIRREAMDRIGGWAEWCITEDTEFGLRVFEAGYTALYTPVSMGRGLMPDTYAAYKMPALPLGVRRHADPEAPCLGDLPGPQGRRHAVADQGAALPVPGGLDALVCRRLRADLRGPGPGLERFDDHCAQALRRAADGIVGRGPGHLHDQDSEDRLVAPHQGRHRFWRRPGARRSPGCRCPTP